MKLSPFNSASKRSTKEYLLYAFGEVLLIVLGILFAMYINKLNSDFQYKNKIDKNINRVYIELEKNLSKASKVINTLQRKDSLIHLYMSDSLEKNDYLENIELSVLIINANNFRVEDESYLNLIQLNVSDNRYQDELISDLKGLYRIYPKIRSMNEKMSAFVVDILIENVDPYGDFAYKGTVDEDLIDYYLTSKDYKSKVIQYAVLAIRNQLKHNQAFYTRGIDIYTQIAEEYDLKNNFDKYSNEKTLANYIGSYNQSLATDSLHIKVEHDSVFLYFPTMPRLHLIPFVENRLYLDNGNLGYFVSFFPDEDSVWTMNIHLLSYRESFKKVK